MNRRIRTINMILNASRIGGQPEAATIANEFNEVVRINSIRPLNRRCLMQVLHSTRALDSTLAVFLRVRGVRLQDGERSLGAYLRRLRNHGVAGMTLLPHREQQHYEHNIVRPRNRYMHQAGAYPPGIHDIQRLLNEMHACLVRALNL